VLHVGVRRQGQEVIAEPDRVEPQLLGEPRDAAHLVVRRDREAADRQSQNEAEVQVLAQRCRHGYLSTPALQLEIRTLLTLSMNSGNATGSSFRDGGAAPSQTATPMDAAKASSSRAVFTMASSTMSPLYVTAAIPRFRASCMASIRPLEKSISSAV